jgi:hypothetical protein
MCGVGCLSLLAPSFRERPLARDPKSGTTGSVSPLIGVLLMTFVVSGASTSAQVRGTYSPGSTLTGAGTVSDPGLVYENQFWYISANQLKGSHGNVIPIHGSLSFAFDNNSVIYVPTFKFLGANLEFSVDVAFSNGRLAARDPFLGGSTSNSSDFGLTNTTFVPFDLGWHLKWASLQTGYSLAAPTGQYVPGATNNVSTGFWTNSWQSGATLFLRKSQSTQISIFNTYAWNTTQQGTGVHPGQNDSIDYSLTQMFSLDKSGRWSLQAGPAGYGQWQTTKNGGQNPAREALTYGVDAVGFTVNLNAPFKGLYVQTSTLWEYAARNTYQGHTLVLTAGFNF